MPACQLILIPSLVKIDWSGVVVPISPYLGREKLRLDYGYPSMYSPVCDRISVVNPDH